MRFKIRPVTGDPVATSSFDPASVRPPPPGEYALGVSGGADSMALWRLSRGWPGVRRVIVHLNHHLRGEQSDADQAFVESTARAWGDDCLTLHLPPDQPGRQNNPSARYRDWRLACFGQVVAERRLDGVLLAHHADDQAESILLRLARGGSLVSLRPMRPVTDLAGLRVYRPLLAVRSAALRAYLRACDQPWREDASNDSPRYRRNVARARLRCNERLTQRLLELADAAQRAIDRLDAVTPLLPPRFACAVLGELPSIVAEQAARHWLIARGSRPEDLSPAVCRRLVAQAVDPAAPLRQVFPGGVWVCRKQKHLEVRPLPAGPQMGRES